MTDKLKILFTNDAPLIVYGIQSGFDNLGHNTKVMTGQHRLWDKPKDIQNDIFEEVIEEFRPDLVFSECFANFSEGIFEITKEKGVFHVFWSIEDTPFDHWIGDHWSDFADYVFTTTAECLPNYWNKRKKAELMLFGCNQKFHQYLPSSNIHDVVLVANNYERRKKQTNDFIIPLLEKYSVSIYGNEWWMDETREVNLINHSDAYKGYCSYEDLPLLYSSSKVVLGQNLDDNSVTQTSMRPYEVLGTGGGILVSPWTPAQEYLFHEHAYLPKSTEEMFDMVNEILSMSDSQRMNKSKAAQEFVYKYHNYDRRAQQVIDAYRR